MIRINLIPARSKKELLRLDLYIFLFFFFVVIAAIGLVYYKNGEAIARQKEAIEKTKAEIAGLQGIYREFLGMERQKKEIERRIKAIDNIKEGRALAARTLYDLSSIIKENVWLKGIKKEGDKFQIDGNALENESISELIELLSRLSYIRDVELVNVEDTKEGELMVKRFVIQGNIDI